MPDENQYLDCMPPLEPMPTAIKPRGQLVEKPKAIIFDIYGTLFISGSGDINITSKQSCSACGLNNLLRTFQIARSSKALLQNFFKAIEFEHRQMRARGIDFPEVQIDRIWQDVLGIKDLNRARQFALEFNTIVNPAYPMPHLKELLAACKVDHLTTGIISNAQFYTPLLFERFLGAVPEALGFHPELVIYSYRLGVAKPSEAIFRHAVDILAHIGIPVTAVLYVGNDMLNDIYPARKAGFKTALFAGDQRSLRLREEDLRCTGLRADLVVTDLIQLTEHF